MKDMFLKFCRMLLGILGVSAVSACGEGILPAPEYGPIMAEYGVPHADYVIKGTVTDTYGNPIKGIQVSGRYEHRTLPDTAYTAADGTYELKGRADLIGPEVDLSFEDIDLDDNGGLFISETKLVEMELDDSGQSWYNGLYSALGVDVKMVDSQTTVCEYGVPYATFVVKGKVVDSEGDPINEILVYAEDEPEPQKVRTNENGYFYLTQEHWFPEDKVDIRFEDCDGDANGGNFGKRTVEVELKQVEKGNDGWYAGVYESDEIKVKM